MRMGPLALAGLRGTVEAGSHLMVPGNLGQSRRGGCAMWYSRPLLMSIFGTRQGGGDHAGLGRVLVVQLGLRDEESPSRFLVV